MQKGAKRKKRRIPRRLETEPLLEAIWELRFEGDPAAGGALPGILYEKIKAEGREAKIEALPLGSVPRNMRDAQDQFRYAPTSALRYNNYTILISDRIAALSVVRPYPGWSEYAEHIFELVQWLQDSGMIKNIEQASVRYLDFFECGPHDIFKKLRVGIHIGDLKVGPGPLTLQLNIARVGFDGTINIANPTSVAFEGQVRQGLVTGVQVSWKSSGDENFWKTFPDKLSAAKKTCHEVFFELLTEETVRDHKPIYED